MTVRIKNGDKVKCCTELDNFTENKEYMVYVDDNCSIYIKDDDGENYYISNYSTSWFKLVENAEVRMDFKVGDVLRCIKEVEGFTIGREYMVCIDPKAVLKYIKDDNSWLCNKYWIERNKDKFEKVMEDKYLKFNHGDRLICLRDSDNLIYNRIYIVHLLKFGAVCLIDDEGNSYVLEDPTKEFLGLIGKGKTEVTIAKTVEEIYGLKELEAKLINVNVAGEASVMLDKFIKEVGKRIKELENIKVRI